MIVTRAPLRIPLGGGGTDLPAYYRKHGGFILSAAVNKYVFITMNRMKVDDSFRIKYSRTEIVNDVNEIEHPLVREALKMAALGGGLEIASMADVPAGTGMGSSGTFLVSLLTALHAYKREYLPTWSLAEEACTIEIDIVGQPSGKHDQYMAAFGGLTCLDIDGDGVVTVNPLKISAHGVDQLRNSLTLYYTGIRRESSDILSEQSRAVKEDRKDVVDCLHTIKEIGLEIKRALEAGDLDRFGRLLDDHWQTKKKLSSKVSGAMIDRWYDVAMDSGALGGKLMGAGGGGFLMFYCDNGAKGVLRQAMDKEGLREMPFDFDFEGAKVLVNF